jgi:ABC-type transport system substrate-binding protein
LSKSKTSTFVAVLALTLMASMLPMNVAGATCDVTFHDAKIFLEDGSTTYLSITVKVEGIDHTTPFTVTFDVCEGYFVEISAVITYGGREYRQWTELQGPGIQYGWNIAGDVDVGLVAQTDNGHLVFHIHCGGGTSTASVEPKYARAGPVMDVLRMPVIRHPDAALIAMQTGTADVWSNLASPMDVYWHKLGEVNGGLLRTGDIEKLAADGFTITWAPGFHIGHIGYNIRPLAIQQERRPGLTVWPLADVHFRHALFHLWDQQTYIAAMFGWTVAPINDLVPPAQGGWMSENVEEHPYNPGDPFAPLSGEDASSGGPQCGKSACRILKDAGYTFVDADSSGTVTAPDYWRCPNGDPVPYMELWTPTWETAPTSAELGARFVQDLGEVGLAARTENGNSGFAHVPREFADYKDDVEHGLFDSYMLFWNLHRFPDHLYDMCHSSQDAWSHPGRNNLPGINDPILDNLLETLMTSLNHNVKMVAAWEAQERQYDPDVSNQALAYMPLYSKIYWSAFHPDLRGIVMSHGFGAHNKWTLLNIHWQPGLERTIPYNNPGTNYDENGKTFIRWLLGEPPERLNPLYAQTKYAWTIMSPVMDGLIMVNPYTHQDIPWLAESWYTNLTPTGMNVTFHLRKDLFWQDGQCYNAHDAKFNWLFLRDNAIPRFASTAQYIQDVEVIDDYTVRVILDETSQFLLYDLAATAAMLPPQVWARWDGKPLDAILAYDPSKDTNATGMGPWFGTDFGPSNRLFGTGPYVFDYYDDVGMVGQLHQFGGYFRITSDVYDQKVEMFHECGDVNYDGIIWADDVGQIGFRYGCMDANYIAPGIPPVPDPCYDPNVDINHDGIIDIGDLTLASYFYGDQREYP